MWFKKEKETAPAPVDPFLQLQKTIDEQTEKLHQASASLEQSSEVIRSINREISVIGEDITRLQNRLGSKNSDYETLRSKLTTRQSELEVKNKELLKAKEENQNGHLVLQNFEKTISDTQNEADRLKITLNLTESQKAATGFKASLMPGSSTVADAKAQITNQIAENVASSKVDESLTNGDESRRKMEDEYLKSAS